MKLQAFSVAGNALKEARGVERFSQHGGVMSCFSVDYCRVVNALHIL